MPRKLAVQCGAEAIVRRGTVRRQTDGFAGLGDGLVHHPLFLKGDAKVPVGYVGVRLQADGFPVFGDPLLL